MALLSGSNMSQESSTSVVSLSRSTKISESSFHSLLWDVLSSDGNMPSESTSVASKLMDDPQSE